MSTETLPPERLPDLPAAELRRAIDAIGMIRMRVVRIGAVAQLLLQPDPSTPDEEERRTNLAILERQVDIIGQVHDLLQRGQPMPEMPPALAAWIARSIAPCRDDLHLIEAMRSTSAALVQAVVQNSRDPQPLLAAHMREARGDFAAAVARLCDHLWADLDRQRLQDLGQAKAAVQTLAERLSRLEHIGKHVRLVSLNASVEAARAGESGKGLMVIAHEFKALAEEIQALARSGADDIAGIPSN